MFALKIGLHRKVVPGLPPIVTFAQSVVLFWNVDPKE